MAESTYNNQGFFSTHHLEKVIKEQTSDALESIYEQIKQLYVKCHRLFRPQFRKVKTSFVVEIREVSNTLTLNAGVSGDTLV